MGISEETSSVLDINKHASIISVIIADLVDRTYIYNVKKYFEQLPDDAKEHPDIVATIEWLTALIMKNITEKKEAVYELKAAKIRDNLKCLLDYSASFSKTFKQELLTALSRDTVVANLEPIVDEIKETIVDIRTFDSDKKSVQKMNSMFNQISSLYQAAQKNKIGSSDSDMLILDPTKSETYNTLPKVMEAFRTNLANRIKTIPALDMMFGGGIASKTLTLFGAWTGNFKSGTMQNLALYIAKNNNKDAFKLDEKMQPCVLFVSLELTIRQLLVRDLSWMGVNKTDDEIKNMSDEEMQALIFEARKKNGITIPIIYAERLAKKKWTTATTIEDMIINLRTSGMQVVAVMVDYLDRMELDDTTYRGSGTGASETSLKLKQKAKELRDMAIKMDVIAVTAAQLNGSVRGIMKQCQQYIKQVDPVTLFGSGMFSSSATLETEVETSIYSHLIEIEEERSDDSSEIVKKTFIAYGLFKDRDGKALPYKKSERDKSTESLERSYRNKLLQNRELRELIEGNIKFHVLIPLDGFRIDEIDYARTIRTYYPSERGSFISMNDVLSLANGQDINLDEL